MNTNKLKQAERTFLSTYPTGFSHPDLAAIGKKHKMDKMIEMAQTSFLKSRFSKHQTIAEDMIKIISRSSMVSMFEKPKFRDFVATLSEKELKQMTNGLKNLLHGHQEKGFNALVDILSLGKLAKWSLVTILPAYFYPNDEVFVKPTTAKGTIEYFELQDVSYKPKPTWDFYQKYKQQILTMKSKVDPSLAPNNAAFCGFLMMSMER